MTKYLLAAALLAFTGCTNPAGMAFYAPMQGTSAEGVTTYKSVKVATFAVDLVGLKRFAINFRTGDVEIDFQKGLLVADQYAVQDKDGKLVGTLTKQTAPGIYTARVIESYGEALQKTIKEAAAGVTGAILSTVTPVALGQGLSAIPIR